MAIASYIAAQLAVIRRAEKKTEGSQIRFALAEHSCAAPSLTWSNHPRAELPAAILLPVYCCPMQ